jgi:hypothetical protein
MARRSRPQSFVEQASEETRAFSPGRLPPPPVAWLHPWQLARTGYHALISTVATEFLDRREMLAALDRVPPGIDGPTALKPVDIGPRGQDRAYIRRDALPDSEDIWIDYSADLGDSWEATYSTALLMASPELEVKGHRDEKLPHGLPRAHVVVLGGDQVYPTPTRTRYRTRFRSAFMAALPEQPKGPGVLPCLLAIPGNHDWYDGLTNFVRVFCQGGLLGGWSLIQTRSYFAAKIANGWWIWGTDIALDTRIDAPQLAYFIDVLNSKHFEKGDQIILCTAKPVWLDDPRHTVEAYKNLSYFITSIVKKHGGCVPVVLAGDIHHYSRFENAAGNQLIVSGGGGAYIVGTHDLPEQVAGLPPVDNTGTIQQSQNSFRAAAFPYPSRAESRHLARGALWLVRRPANWPFALFSAVVYWLMAWPVRNEVARLFTTSAPARQEAFAELIRRAMTFRTLGMELAILTACGLFAITANHRPRLAAALWGLAHGLAQIVLALALAAFFSEHAGIAHALSSWIHRVSWIPGWTLALARVLAFAFASAVLGPTLLGLYLVLSYFLWHWHRNDVFSVQSIIDYRNFLRMKIDRNGVLSIYPIGLRRVPRQWRARSPLPASATKRAGGQKDPSFQPGDERLTPHLIEAPLRVQRGVPSV